MQNNSEAALRSVPVMHNRLLCSYGTSCQAAIPPKAMGRTCVAERVQVVVPAPVQVHNVTMLGSCIMQDAYAQA